MEMPVHFRCLQRQYQAQSKERKPGLLFPWWRLLSCKGMEVLPAKRTGRRQEQKPQIQPRKQTGNEQQQGGRIYDKLIVKGKPIATQEETAAAFTTD